MIRMHERIHRHEICFRFIPVHFVDLKKLPAGVAGYDKAVLRKLLPLLVIQIELIQIVDIAQIRRNRIGLHTGRHADVLICRRIFHGKRAVECGKKRCPVFHRICVGLLPLLCRVTGRLLRIVSRLLHGYSLRLIRFAFRPHFPLTAVSVLSAAAAECARCQNNNQ